MVNLTNVLTDLAGQAIVAKLAQKQQDNSGQKSSPYGSVGQLAANFFGGNNNKDHSSKSSSSQPPYSQSQTQAAYGGGNPDPYYGNTAPHSSSSQPNTAAYGSGGGGVDPYYSSTDQYQQQQQQSPQQQMYNNNNNSGGGGYQGYPPNAPPGQAQGQGYYGGGYPPAQPGGYGNAPSYGGGSSSSIGFGGEPPYTGGAPYPGGGGGGGAPYPGGVGGAPYPGGGTGGAPGVGFNVGGSPYPPSSMGFSSAQPPPTGVYPTQVMDTVRQTYGGPQQPYSNYQPNPPYSQQPPPHQQQQQQGQYGHQHPPQFQQQQQYNTASHQPQIMSSRPTLHANPNFNANASAEMLRKAMKGFGCDKNKIIQALCSCTNWQRQEVARAFKVMYGKELIGDLKSELSGDFEDLVLALMEPPAQYDAHQLHDAMAVGFGTKESVLIEIMTTRTNAQINAVKQTYRQMYQTELECDIVGDTSGHFQRLLVSLCAGGRDESCRVDALKANQDARSLYRAGEQRLGTDESQFNAILASQNPYQLRAVFDEYQKVSGGHSIEQAIQSEFSGDLLNGLMAVVKCVRNRAGYFAELIYNSMKGLGTRDADLIRLVVSRAEIDLADIRDAYQRQYNTPLEKAIAGDCSGAYKDGLIALVKGRAI